MDPDTGNFRLEGIAEPLTPRMSLMAFTLHPAHDPSAELASRRAANHRSYGLPEVEIAGGVLEGCRAGGTMGFTNGELESLWIHLLTEGRDGAPCSYDRDDPRLLDLQERWLRQEVGVASGEYPWGLVWNRFNINGGFHDISIVFTAAGRRR